MRGGGVKRGNPYISNLSFCHLRSRLLDTNEEQQLEPLHLQLSKSPPQVLCEETVNVTIDITHRDWKRPI